MNRARPENSTPCDFAATSAVADSRSALPLRSYGRCGPIRPLLVPDPPKSARCGHRAACVVRESRFAPRSPSATILRPLHTEGTVPSKLLPWCDPPLVRPGWRAVPLHSRHKSPRSSWASGAPSASVSGGLGSCSEGPMHFGLRYGVLPPRRKRPSRTCVIEPDNPCRVSIHLDYKTERRNAP